MPLSAQDYAGRTRDSVWERDLARELRGLPEDEKLGFIGDLARANTVVAADLARRCLGENRSYEVLLGRALDEASPDGIRYWLACVVPRLGFRRVVSRLRSRLATSPGGVARAAYWLPMFAATPGYSARAIEGLRATLSAKSADAAG